MTEAQQKKLTPKQVELVNRALRGDELPLFVGRGREINRRANALSEAREELAERMRAAEGNPAEHELIKAQLQFVAAKLDEYGALEVRPHWFGKGAQQEKKEKVAATKISDMMGIGEDGLKKAIWCLRNSVPITKMNLARDKKYLLEAVK